MASSGLVSVHLVFPSAISHDEARSCLTAAELSRAGRFRFHEDADHWIACRAQLRRILGDAINLPPDQVPLMISTNGKPELSPPFLQLHFNLSHCSKLAIIALSSDGPVGVDLEQRSRAEGLLGCEVSFCHPLEIDSLPSEPADRAGQLLQIWTCKEAVLKALGTGLSHPPAAVRILFQPSNCSAISDLPLAGIEAQRLHPLQHPVLDPYQAVLSAPLSVERILII